MFTSKKRKQLKTYQEKIRQECQIKGAGWFGFQAGKSRPRRIRMDNLELGWTAWKFNSSSEIFWYNTLTDIFQEVKPKRDDEIVLTPPSSPGTLDCSRREPTEFGGSSTRKCPGCNYEMELTYPSQFCSRSCMYENV
jgi:hypothetical protein